MSIEQLLGKTIVEIEGEYGNPEDNSGYHIVFHLKDSLPLTMRDLALRASLSGRIDGDMANLIDSPVTKAEVKKNWWTGTHRYVVGTALGTVEFVWHDADEGEVGLWIY